MRTGVGHDPVTCARRGRVTQVGDDRMEGDRWVDPQLTDGKEQRMSERQFADARWVFSSEAGKEEVGLVLSQEGLTCLAESARRVADPRPEVSYDAADNWSTSVGVAMKISRRTSGTVS